MRVRFVESLKVQQPDGNGPEYLKGSVHDFTGFVAETYGRKYVRRGYAVEEPAVVAEAIAAAVAPEAADSSPVLPAATETPAEAKVDAPTPTRQERRRNRRASR